MQKSINRYTTRDISLSTTVVDTVKRRKLQLFGHICRMDDRLAKTVMLRMFYGDRPQGRRSRRWIEDGT